MAQSHKIVEFILAADVADTTDVSVDYPDGTNQAFFTGVNAAATGVVIINDNDVYTEADATVVITYDTSEIDITNDSGVTWEEGSRVMVQLAYEADLVLEDITATSAELNLLDGVTATTAEINAAADLSARQRAVTATADGLTTGLLTTADRWINITSASANNIVMLPAAAAAFIGLVIEGWVGANGHEIRCDGTACTINGLDCKTTNEAAIPATHRWRATCVAAETWLLEGDTELGARVTIVPDAV